MPELPVGTITYLFTDVEGSTRLWQQHPDEMKTVMARHDSLLMSAVEANGGSVVRPRGEGDSIFAVFLRASDALSAACDAQRFLIRETWPEGAAISVRMAMHTGESELRDHDYYGPVVNRCAYALMNAPYLLRQMTASNLKLLAVNAMKCVKSK